MYDVPRNLPKLTVYAVLHSVLIRVSNERISVYSQHASLNLMDDLIGELLSLELLSATDCPHLPEIRNRIAELACSKDTDPALRLRCAYAMSEWDADAARVARSEVATSHSVALPLRVRAVLDICPDGCPAEALSIIQDTRYSCPHRYRAFTSIFKASNPVSRNFIAEKFIGMSTTSATYKIMAAQIVLAHDDPSSVAVDLITSYVLDETMAMDTRAHAADVAANTASIPELAEIGRAFIMRDVGGASMVHSSGVLSSVDRGIETILARTCLHNAAGIDLDDLRSLCNENDKCALEETFDRIICDQTPYTRFQLTLERLVEKAYTLALQIDKDRDNSTHVRTRLVEELVDGAKSCAVGIVARVVNTFSGMDIDDTLGLYVAVEDQIITAVRAKLNKRALELDEDEQSLVVEQMAIDSSNFSERIEFNEFFINHFPNIRQELFMDYKNIISDQEFDMYIKKAILHYVGSLYT